MWDQGALRKLQSMGIRAKTLQRLDSFLTIRKMIVVTEMVVNLHNCRSSLQEVLRTLSLDHPSSAASSITFLPIIRLEVRTLIDDCTLGTRQLMKQPIHSSSENKTICRRGLMTGK